MTALQEAPTTETPMRPDTVPPRGRGVRTPRGPASLYVVSIVAAAVVLILLLVVLWSTFVQGLPGISPKLSLANYIDVLGSSPTWTALVNSLIIGVGTVVVNLLIAVPLAYLVQRTDLPGRRLVTALLLMGVAVPGFVKAMGWILLLSPEIGIINVALQPVLGIDEGPFSIYGLPGIIFLQGLAFTPLMYFMIAGSMANMNPQLEEAALMSGARRITVIRRIVAPLLTPAVFAAVIFNFVTAIAIFDIQNLLGSPAHVQTLPLLIFSAIQATAGLPQYGVAGVYGLLLLVPTMVALYFYQRQLSKGRRWMVVTGKGYRPTPVRLGRWRPLAAILVGVYFLLSLGLPAITVVWTSLLPYVQAPSAEAFQNVSLAGYTRVFSDMRPDVIVNTIVMMLAVGVIVTLLSLCISWTVVRTRFPGRRTIDTLATLPQATPSIVFGFAVAFVALSIASVIPIYGTIGVIIAAHSVAFLGFGSRTMNASVAQLHTELEEAALVHGAGFWQIMRRIAIPILTPTLFYVFMWTTLLSVSEVTMALLLQTPRNSVIATQIWGYFSTGNTGPAAALATILIIVTVAGFGSLVSFASKTGVRA